MEGQEIRVPLSLKVMDVIRMVVEKNYEDGGRLDNRKLLEEVTAMFNENRMPKELSKLKDMIWMNIQSMDIPDGVKVVFELDLNDAGRSIGQAVSELYGEKEFIQEPRLGLQRLKGLKTNKDTEQLIAEELGSRIGIPKHIKGYHYLVYAVNKVIEDKNLLSGMTKELYPMVAEEFQTTPSRVERAIRHVIEKVSDADYSMEYLSKLFKYVDFNKGGKPTNSEFIAEIAEKISFELKMSA